MKAFFKLVLTLAILAGFLLGGYWWYRLRQARDVGEDYPISRAPADLVRDVRGLFRSGETAREEPEPEEADDPASAEGPGEKEPTEEGPELPPRELEGLERARVLFDEGRYRKAGGILLPVVADPSAPPSARRLLDRARLFELLLEDSEPGSVLGDGHAYARFTMPGGQTFFARVVRQTPETLEFKQEAGLGATVEKGELRDLVIAETEEEKRALFEREYRRRHETAHSSGALLELARFSRTHGLPDHLTYLMEKGLSASGDGMEKGLVDRFRAAERAGHHARMELIRNLARKFFTGGELAERICTGPSIDAGSPAAGPDGGADLGPDAEPGPEGRGGIVEVARRTPRKSDPEVNRLLEKADELRRTGDVHYRKALPGKPNAAAHRKKALDAYTEALGLYEQAEERWGVSLDSTFKDIQERRYQLLKDSR